MLPKSHRLPASEIQTVLKQGRKITMPMGQLIFRQTQNPVSRFAFVVSARIDKRAVVRNRIKRLLRESIRHLLPQIAEGRDFVIIAKKNISGLNQSETDNLIKSSLLQSGALRR